MKKILINVLTNREVRVAVISTGNSGGTATLHDLHIEQSNNRLIQGNVYKAKVCAVKDELDAAFVDYGEVKQGLLALSRVEPLPPPPKASGDAPTKARISDYLKVGDDILVQVDKDPRADKGAALTTRIQLHGQHVVLTTNRPRTRISRMIVGTDREKMLETLAKIKLPKGAGLVARTSSAGKDMKTMQQDVNECVRLLELIEQAYKQSEAPRLLYEENNLVNTVLRDNLHTSVEEILVDDANVYNDTVGYVRDFMPDFQGKILQYEDALPLFTKYKIEKQANRVFDREISLPSGGQIVLDPTEAFLAVDVNSARSKYKNNFNDMVLNTNLEAVDELFRQMCLRDIGGLIVVDFIDMNSEDDIRKVEARVERACQRDRYRTKSESISSFGLMQLQRRRTRSSIYDTAFETCTNCSGYGHIRTVSSIAHHIYREIETKCYDRKVTRIRSHVTPDVAAFLTNELRSHLSVLEIQSKTTIEIIPDLDDDNGTYVTHSYRSPYSNKPRHTESFEQGKPKTQAPERKRNGNRKTPADSIQEAAVSRADLGNTASRNRTNTHRSANRRDTQSRKRTSQSKASTQLVESTAAIGRFFLQIYKRLFSVDQVQPTNSSRTKQHGARTRSRTSSGKAKTAQKSSMRTRQTQHRDNSGGRDERKRASSSSNKGKTSASRSQQSSVNETKNEGKQKKPRPTSKSKAQIQNDGKQSVANSTRGKQKGDRDAAPTRAEDKQRESRTRPSKDKATTESVDVTPSERSEARSEPKKQQASPKSRKQEQQSELKPQETVKARNASSSESVDPDRPKQADKSTESPQDQGTSEPDVSASLSPDRDLIAPDSKSQPNLASEEENVVSNDREESADLFEIGDSKLVASSPTIETSEQLEAVHADDSEQSTDLASVNSEDVNGNEPSDSTRASNDPRNMQRNRGTQSGQPSIDVS